MMEKKNQEVIYKVSPHFSFIYELFMPTGRKIKNTIIILVIMCIASILIINNIENMNIGDFVLFADLSVLKLLAIICIIVDIFLVLKLIFHIVFQTIQYKYINYYFYENYMVYEDDFLNQHRKNIEYSNIKEVEIRRTIIDRILGYGVIVIYTNAENKINNGLVIYALKNPRESYDIIDEIIHKGKLEKTEIKSEKDRINSQTKVNVENLKNTVENNDEESNNGEIFAQKYDSEEERIKRVEESQKESEEFFNSLKNINEESNK